jgi:hypothetical protein
MRRVRIQGCLPSLLVLLAVAALTVVAFTAGLAVMLVTAGVLVLLALVRTGRRLLGLGPPTSEGGRAAPAARSAGARSGGPGVEAVPPGWMEREAGPVVEAGPRDPQGGPGAEEDPLRDGERTLPPRG